MARAGARGGHVRRRPHLATRIFAAMAIFSTAAAVLATVAATFVYQDSVVDDARVQLERETDIVRGAVEDGSSGGTAAEIEVLSGLDLGNLRATLVDGDGTVLYDSEADAATLPNHNDRPEIVEARSSADGTGSSERRSSTLGSVSLYRAVMLPSGHVLRVSLDRAGVRALLTQNLPVLASIIALLLVVSWVASRLIAQRLVRPILRIDPQSELAHVAPYEELEPLTDRLDEQRRELLDQMRQLESADQIRREFTANVTHELKTPLASISGASELIKEGLVAPEDISDFAGRIYSESRRLTSLVNDILTLSKLDETERMGDAVQIGSFETVDLFAVARDVEERLSQKADDANVMLVLEGAPVRVQGRPQLLDELVYNLVDNAIRYNHPGGWVRVVVCVDGGRPTIRVSDTGIGIPEDKRDKVFERFYRVEKSRSRASGGTGLGLAIVKHAAAVHGATVELDSTMGVGTTFTVRFPSEHGPSVGE